MRHSQNRNTGTEHIIAREGLAGTEYTYCGETVYGSSEIDAPNTAARVEENLCERCRRLMDDSMTLYELADEANL